MFVARRDNGTQYIHHFPTVSITDITRTEQDNARPPGVGRDACMSFLHSCVLPFTSIAATRILLRKVRRAQLPDSKNIDITRRAELHRLNESIQRRPVAGICNITVPTNQPVSLKISKLPSSLAATQ